MINNTRMWAQFSRFFVPALLTIIALIQVYRAHAYNQSSWIGCGFGMFASINHGHFLRAVATVDGEQFQAKLANSLDEKIKRLNAMPSQENLQSLAESMLEADWRREGNQYQMLDNREAKGEELEKVHLEYWKIDFDVKTNQLSSSLKLENDFNG